MTIFTRIGPIAPATYTKHGLTEVEAMNALQDAGVISDNCERIEDIAEADRLAVIRFFDNYSRPK